LAVADKLKSAGVLHIVVREIDPPYTGQATAIGIAPILDRKRIKPILSSLPLLRDNPLAQVA